MRVIFLFLPLLLFADSIIKYLNLKPFYYENQIANIKIKVISTEKNLSFFSPNLNIEINKTNPYIYLLNVKFKADNSNKNIFIFPTKEIINLNNKIKIKKLYSTPPHFSHIFADNLRVINPISTISNGKTILSFSIKCTLCNLKDFNLKEINSSLIDSDKEATFLVYLPKNQKNFSFYYFNLKENRFKKVSIPIIIKEDKISTQTDLNSNETKLFTPLNIILISISIFIALLYFVYKKVFIILISLIPLIPIGMQILPKGTIFLKKGSKLRILPTENSTIIYTVKKPVKAIILKKVDNYIKVKLNNKIGWVKNETN